MTNPTASTMTRDALAREFIRGQADEDLFGLLFHPMVFIRPDHDPDAPSPLGPSTRELIVDRGIRHLCLGAMPSPTEAADIIQSLQAIATSHGTRLPITFSSDPRHSFLQNLGASHRADGMSQWPEPIGLGAIDDDALVETFARIVRDDYRAIGIRMALHPQVDLATEPRWARQAQSFGVSPQKTARLLRAFLIGLQGDRVSGSTVAATVKHFPGGGPQRDGEDPHFSYGREQVYPGGRFEDHLLPFRTAVELGAAAIMPYYGMPVGLELGGAPVEEVGFAFNKRIITDLLRDQLGFEGVVLSDFGLINDAAPFGKPFPARAWGVEHLDGEQRMARLINAGIDQLGGESDTVQLGRLLEDGRISHERFREAVTRVVALTLDLFPGARLPDAPPLSGLEDREHVALGHAAQSRAITVLVNEEIDGHPVLPLAGPGRIHLRGIEESALPAGWSVASANDADLAIVRLSAPFELRDRFFLEASMEQGSLEFSDEVTEEIRDLAALCPVVVCVTLSRPAILTSLLPHVTALVADFGASDTAVFDALSLAQAPEGRLPFELPRSMAAVVASSPDVGSDSGDPVFPVGAGLRLTRS
ncbi:MULTISPECIES: glycoside hydrolase family 3 protein [unclassified Microbacterium]|uniref:glycoside hydrolase family 3 protein n=1 Tax=unclassified Microbacterium TaxID=2609290 RepID=UPI000EA8D9AF|nr:MULTISPECIES: glycoside hydrolase family 3 N-terminal domain-containing protein [unclassified Microbacterium]MBT2486490.1 glycoside hydrolase family 3 C-terminal domain-containing protein [Microbacterium sp. ISL-108]RKN69187.1 glycoside hydrolase family 3 protein [Microbacterium sp. CGR2]